MFFNKYREVGGKSLIEMSWFADIVGPSGCVKAKVFAASSWV
jgi:hypothetical protein